LSQQWLTPHLSLEPTGHRMHHLLQQRVMPRRMQRQHRIQLMPQQILQRLCHLQIRQRLRRRQMELMQTLQLLQMEPMQMFQWLRTEPMQMFQWLQMEKMQMLHHLQRKLLQTSHLRRPLRCQMPMLLLQQPMPQSRRL
jgi:hypothetical protein